MTQGAVDAWATWEPYTAMAETAGHARVLVNGRGLSSGLSFIAATDKAIAAKHAALQDFTLRVVRAQRWSYDHVTEYSAVLSRVTGIAPDAARLQFERRAQRWIAVDAKVLADQQATADFYLDVGLLKQRLDVKNTFDAGFTLG
jgi:sulfonate transport system substrate-binding protein